jgi:hypothetical protein
MRGDVQVVGRGRGLDRPPSGLRRAKGDIRKAISCGIIAIGMAPSLVPGTVLAAPPVPGTLVRAVAPRHLAAKAPSPMPPILPPLAARGGGGGQGGGGGKGGNGQSGDRRAGGGSDGTSTPELPTSGLIAIGLLAPVLVAAIGRRRHRSR